MGRHDGRLFYSLHMKSFSGPAAAFGVHLFTAFGAVIGFLALLEAVAHRWEAAFAWLGLALIIDGVDGVLARRVKVATVLPRFSGERLDLIIDYLTYVIVPAMIIHEARLVPEALAMPAAALILLASLFHFSDRDSKTDDGFFVGFPALWNVIALYMMLFATPPLLNFLLLAIFAVLTFIPFKWVHPIRVRHMRVWTMTAVTAWSVATAIALFKGFPAHPAAQAIIALSTLYVVALGLRRSF